MLFACSLCPCTFLPGFLWRAYHWGLAFLYYFENSWMSIECLVNLHECGQWNGLMSPSVCCFPTRFPSVSPFTSSVKRTQTWMPVQTHIAVSLLWLLQTFLHTSGIFLQLTSWYNCTPSHLLTSLANLEVHLPSAGLLCDSYHTYQTRLQCYESHNQYSRFCIKPP